ncbi:serine phosphatase RsbU (regulator of sigma subunit) [Kitasatospora sp. GAS204A]|uniref:PP2C family protein-serine/threonine phosphatase n=1 Tax=unclassified Kitasatospora TaxID=2633591 RepID=UPI0024757B82|nr:PP2C family protein-serine/threonine phosphatase [Kitasatospora sp. GAS204B]MDH6115806.1 serine phosphatase RsbU (regulator of sigma subunit) [Kitasatospora sp. GAS204B]
MSARPETPLATGPAAAPSRKPAAESRRAPAAVLRRALAGPTAADREPDVAARWVRWLPALLILADLLIEVVLPQATAAGFLLTALPVLVAFGFGALATALSGVGAVALQLVLAARVGHLYEHHHLWVYLSTLIAALAGVMLSHQRTRQARHLVRARTVSEALQRTVLHPVPEQVGALRTAGRYRAAQAEVAIGGDLYELCDTRFGTRVLLGDVRGKGLEAVRTVADLLGAFRATAHETADLAELAALLDRQVRRGAVECGDEELFVTAVLLEHHQGTGAVRLINRGHLDPVLLAGGAVQTLHCPQDLPLGLGHLRAQDAPSPVAVVPLIAGQTLLLHTDGVTEARDRAGRFYPLTERLAGRFQGRSTVAPEQLVAFVGDDVQAHGGPATDDLALLALSPLG